MAPTHPARQIASPTGDGVRSGPPRPPPAEQTDPASRKGLARAVEREQYHGRRQPIHEERESRLPSDREEVGGSRGKFGIDRQDAVEGAAGHIPQSQCEAEQPDDESRQLHQPLTQLRWRRRTRGQGPR